MKSSCRMSIEERNCYCNGPGIWSMNMIQCSKCRRWYHDGCISALQKPILYGDRFFVFVCSICNSGSEYLCRMELKWVDIVHLVLYNLTVMNRKKYFCISTTLIPFLNENWSKLRLIGDIASTKSEEREKFVHVTLDSRKKRFKNGKEIKKSRFLWGLREAMPPVAPHVTPVAKKNGGKGFQWEFKIPGRQTKVLCMDKNFRSVNNSVNKGSSSRINAAMKNSSHINVAMKNSRHINAAMKNSRQINAAVKTSRCVNGAVRSGHISKIKSEFKKVPNQNCSKKTTCKVRKPKPQFRDDDFTFNLLDTLVPTLPNFTGPNNPFRKLKKCASYRSNRHCRSPHKEPVIHRLTVKTPVIHKLSQERFNGQQVIKEEPPDVHGTNGTFLPPSLKSSPLKNFLDDKCHLKNLVTAKTGGGLSVKGKRMTPDGHVQYLFEWYT